MVDLTVNHIYPKVRIIYKSAIRGTNQAMSSKEITYKLNLSGGDITVKDHSISEQIALKIIALVMGGAAGAEPDSVTVDAARPGVEQDLGGPRGRQLSPKAFMAEKRPSSEIERMTCLAYYLSRYRNTTAFKTREITKLNTEAAQPNFSNAAVFARNADTAGYLSKAGGGSKQITVLGEAVVDAMPDREKVKAAIENNKVVSKRRASRRGRKSQK